MIFNKNGNYKFEYETPLIKFLKRNYNYSGENLVYSTKYSQGTFSIRTPNLNYKNCSFINNYPHFEVSLEICLKEIKYFLKNKNLYKQNFIIRFGDTHPHNILPKLAQLRNIILTESLCSMIGKKSKTYYCIGDISKKSLSEFLNGKKINVNEIVDEMYYNLTHNISTKLLREYKIYVKEKIDEISNFFEKLSLSKPKFVLESNLYKNIKLFNTLINDNNLKSEIKENGHITYNLQELMFIFSINSKKILISLICSNQNDHIKKVNDLLLNYKFLNVPRFFNYGKCCNAEIRIVEDWICLLNSFIYTHNLKINNKFLTPLILLKILFVTFTNENQINFSNLNKYLPNIEEFCEICEIIFNKNTCVKSFDIKENNALICKMSLVNYYLNKSIELGNQKFFYNYILDLIKEYKSNDSEYLSISNYFKIFIKTCLNRIRFKEIL